jgi:amino acid adenylation domain-containing protein
LVAQARFGLPDAEHAAYFRALLGDVDEPTTPFGLGNVQRDGTSIGQARSSTDRALAARIRRAARGLGVSAASLWHVAWAQVVARLSGRTDVVFGTVLLGRMQGGATDRAMGLFINTLPVRVRVDGRGVAACVRATHRQLTALLRHEHASLALAQRCSGVTAPTPLFSALLNYRHSAAASDPIEARALDGIEVVSGEERTNYPLTVSVDDLGDGFAVTAQVEASVVAPARVCGWLQTAMHGLVTALETAPATPMVRVDVLSSSERAALLTAGTAPAVPFPADRCVHEWVEAQVAQTPDALAVVTETGAEALTYGALDAAATQLAHHLRALGVGPDVRVAICLEREPRLVVAILAVLKAGGAYVPLDPTYPTERRAFLVRDSAPAALITTEALGASVAFEGPVVALDGAVRPWTSAPVTPLPRAGLTSAHAAYVIYTSGSTGTPKGVVVAHAQVSHILGSTAADFGFGPGDVWTLFHSTAFDFSVWELWGALCYGGRVVIVSRATAQDPPAVAALLVRERVTVLNQTPSSFRALQASGALASDQHRLRVVIFGGEALDVGTLGSWYAAHNGAGPQLVNMYGITETTVHVTYGPLAASDVASGGSPIGRPMPNTQVYLLDAHGMPVPVGVTGEIYVGGAGVARGYLGRPGLTAERFVANPFGAVPGARSYRSGDLGQWRADGTLAYLGRNDFQVKVRGFRIELGEITAAVRTIPRVTDAIVLAAATAAGDTRLVAYYTGDPVDAETVRQALLTTLPDYMVPAAYVHVDAWPLTPNGKLDRAALPAPDATAFATHVYEAPVGPIETALAEIWSEVLGVERVGRHDNFFALGGHSLLAVRALARVQQRITEGSTLQDLFAQPVLAAWAARLAQLSEPMLAPLSTRSRQRDVSHGAAAPAARSS